jgi:hypothetical protein
MALLKLYLACLIAGAACFVLAWLGELAYQIIKQRKEPQ